MAADVIDVTDATLAQDVLDESKRRPVVVDFWADWCQPCRLIGTVLERLAGEHQGQFRLAKLDVDGRGRRDTTPPRVDTAGGGAPERPGLCPHAAW